MKKNIKFVGFHGETHHKKLVSDLIDNSIAKFDLYSKFQGNMTIRKVSAKYSPSSELFLCELDFHGDQRRGHLFFKKSGRTLLECLRLTLDAAEKSLRRESKTRQSRMRRHFTKINRLIEQAA